MNGVPGDVLALPVGDGLWLLLVPTIVLHFKVRGSKILLSLLGCHLRHAQRADFYAVKYYGVSAC